MCQPKSDSAVSVVQAGTAFKLISGAVHMVGWLACFAGAALKAGDCLIQTRRVVKVILVSYLRCLGSRHTCSHALPAMVLKSAN